MRAPVAWARLGHALFGAALSGLLAAVLDASWARDAGGDSVAHARLAVYLDDAGVVAPVALGLGFAAWLVAWLVNPEAPPSPRSLARALRRFASGRPADVAAFTPLAVLAAFFWATLVAHLARAALALDVAPALAGAAVATGALGLGLVAALVALAITPPLRHALATASEGRPAFVDPAMTGGVALAIVGALVAFGVATGSVSGEGGLLGIWGVLKRQELDLRAPMLAACIFAGAFFLPALTRSLRKTIAFGVAVVSLGLTARAAKALNAEPGIALAIERGAPLGKPAMQLLRNATDRDGDGFSPYFGGGDCDDSNPNINPLAREIPDNGIDEDCDGRDLKSSEVAPALGSSASAPLEAPNEPAPASVPDDLNIVLITIDTVRADLGFLGYPRNVSPRLDALAKDSTVYEHAYSLASYTGKSVGPLLIGKYPSETHRNWGHFNRFSDEDTTLAERLHKAGMRTVSVQGHRYFAKFSGLDRGFDVVDLSAAPPDGAKWDVDNTTTSEPITDAVLKQLSNPENTRGRFFLWVHYLDPHADYLHHDGFEFGNSQRDLYDGEIAFTDHHVGRVLDAIAEAPWGKRTVIVVTSDHGEAFGEHKMYRHGFELWEPLVHVPLLVHVPGAPPHRIALRRSAIDVVPTLLALAHAPPPSGDRSDSCSGASLVPELFGAEGKPRDVLVDMPAGPYNDARRSFIHGSLKLTISNGVRMELYDLESDPEEAHDLWQDSSARAQIESAYRREASRLHEIKVVGDRKP